MDFDTKESREKVEFYLKLSVAAVGAFWLLFAGTDIIDRKSKQLGTEAIPNARTKLSVNWQNTADTMLEEGVRHCLLDGNFRLTNVGELTFKIEHIEFELYRLQNVPKPGPENIATSYSAYPRLFPGELEQSKNPGDPVSDVEVLQPADYVEGTRLVIPVNVHLSKDNQVSRSFGYLVRDEVMPEYPGFNYSYVVVANAKGGLPEKEGGWIGAALEGLSYLIAGQYQRDFTSTDLRTISKMSPICSPEDKEADPG